MISETNLTEITDLNLNEQKSQKMQEDLNQVSLTEKELEQIKDNMNKMVDAAEQNPSYFSRAADLWAKIPWWIKIIVFILLTIPTLVSGIVIHSPLLIVISVFSLITLSLSAFFLENHYRQNVNRTEHLKVTLNGLTDTLGKVILSLDNLREKLASQVQQFQLENEKLMINVQDLGEEIKELAVQRKLLQETEQSLRKTNTDLEKTSNTLKQSVEEHTHLLEENEKQLQKVQAQFELAESNLANKVEELNQFKLDMDLKVDNLGKWINSLEGLITTFSDRLQLDKDQKQAFHEKLDLFLKDKEQSFVAIADRICRAEEELLILKEEYKKLNIQYEQLLDRGEQQIERLEHIQLNQLVDQPPKNAKILTKMGIYANNKPSDNTAPTIQTQIGNTL